MRKVNVYIYCTNPIFGEHYVWVHGYQEQGLAVHRAIRHTDEEGYVYLARQEWTVTHLYSGRRIATTRTLAAARYIVKKLLPTTNWAAESLKITPELVLVSQELGQTWECCRFLERDIGKYLKDGKIVG